MNIRNVLREWVFLAVIFTACFVMQPTSASAANINFSQQILPVRFVYLEKDGSIDHVWSNVTEKDSGYVVKIFDVRQKEVSTEQKMILNYVEKSKKVTISRQSTQETLFVESSIGIEEIKTVV